MPVCLRDSWTDWNNHHFLISLQEADIHSEIFSFGRSFLLKPVLRLWNKMSRVGKGSGEDMSEL